MNDVNRLKYTKDHEWVRVDGDVLTVGITDHAQSELGDITFIDLPDISATFDQGDEAATIESVKAASEVFCPASGEIIEVNAGLADKPELINSSPYDDGWIYKLKASDVSQLNDLMNKSQYDEFTKTH
ncbi:MAG: glycine cleavage system protein GcvH [Planctomycetota bacterium]